MAEAYTYTKTYGNTVLYRGYKDGKTITAKVPYKPTLYVKSDDGASWKDIFGNPLKPIKFRSIKEAKEYVSTYKGVSNFEIHGNTSYHYQMIKEMFKGKIEFDFKQTKILITDIETSVDGTFPNVLDPQERVTHITVVNLHDNMPITFCLDNLDMSDTHVDFRYFETEAELLRAWVLYVQNFAPDILSGFYSDGFDYPYLAARIERILGEEWVKKLSPFDMYRWDDFEKEDGSIDRKVEIIGTTILDFLAMYKKFSGEKHEENGLGFIASYQLGTSKLDNPCDSFQQFTSGVFDVYDAPSEDAHEIIHLGYKRTTMRLELQSNSALQAQYDELNKGVIYKTKKLFCQYNIIDATLVRDMDRKLRLFELCLTATYRAKCNIGDILGTTKMWECKIHDYLYDRQVATPNYEKKPSRNLMGAYVKEPLAGRYEWEVSVDAEALYPCIMMSWNISPETLMPEMINCDVDMVLNRTVDVSSLSENNSCMTMNGAVFTKNVRGFIPAIIEQEFALRKTVKNEMLQLQSQIEVMKKNNEDCSEVIRIMDNLDMTQKSVKLSNNSLYGSFGQKHFKYFDIRTAEAITSTGQVVTKTCEIAANEIMNKLLNTENEDYVIMSHTDSLFIAMGEIVSKHFSHIQDDNTICDKIDQVVKDKITPAINAACKSITEYTNSYENRLNLKREKIGRYGIHLPTKNRYAVMVLDNEGVRYATPKLSVTGLEIVRSSTPANMKKTLKKALEMVLMEDEKTVQAYIETEYKKFMLSDVKEIAFPKSCNGISKWSSNVDEQLFKKGCPIQVRAAIMHNKELSRLKMTSAYPAINDGDKIKFVYLKEPNTLRQNVIGFKGKLPTEFGLHKYIDYDMMWDKTFIEPLKSILDVVGWRVEGGSTIDDMWD